MEDNNTIDIKKMEESMNKSEIRMFGKPFVDMSHDYVKNEKKYYDSVLDLMDGTDNLNDKDYKMLKDYLLNQILRMTRSAYLTGLYDGHKYEGDPYETDDITVDKNFMIMFDFHDNDFGQLVEDGANKWCELWNAKVHTIGMYKDHNITCDDFYVDLDNLEKLENVSRIITNGICSSNINFQNEYDRFCNKSVPEYVDLLDECRSRIAYLGSYNINNYRKGSIEEIEKYTINEYKDMQEDGDKTPFNKVWLNGEVLFIKVEHGYATAFVK